MVKVLVTAKQLGSVNVVKPVAQRLIDKGHEVTIYATGNENEAAGFGDVPYEKISPTAQDYLTLVKDQNVVVAGLSGYDTPDGHFIRTANHAGIPTIGLVDQDINYPIRLGDNPEEWPTILATLDKGCFKTIQREYEDSLAQELIERARVVGWVAFDHFTLLKDSFRERDRSSLLSRLELNSQDPIHMCFSQNIHPNSDYMRKVSWTEERKQKEYEYETSVVKAIFSNASDSGIKIVVKPHPGEKYKTNFTKDLANKHGFVYLPADACDTRQLMLAGDSIVAGRSTCLTEACLLDRNVGGIVPDTEDESLQPFPPLALDAIPYTRNWEDIGEVLRLVSSSDEKSNRKLAEMRRKFSVDGKATERVVSLVESLL